MAPRHGPYQARISIDQCVPRRLVAFGRRTHHFGRVNGCGQRHNHALSALPGSPRPGCPPRRLRTIIGVLATAILLPAAIATAATSTSSPAPLAVRVVGNHLVNGAGAPLTLRGVNVSGTEFSCIQAGTASNRGWSIYGGQP